MKHWDAGARVRAGLAALNAAALAVMLEGWLQAGASAGAAIGVFLVLSSFRKSEAGGPLVMSDVPVSPGGVFLGRGFEWDLASAQETLESGRPAVRNERDLVLPDRLTEQHILVLGTTGAGKTRLLELLVLQAVARGDAVVVIDPKGDDSLLRRVRSAAGARFLLFSLTHPERSVEYNPIGRYHDVREVADRVAGLLPSTGDALPFRNYAWDVIHTVAKELHGKKPVTLRNLKRHAIDRPVPALRERPREHMQKMLSALPPLLSKLSARSLSPAKGGLSWEAVDQERRVVYFDLGSLLGGDSSSAVARLTLADLTGFVGSRYATGKGNGTVWLFIDELGDVVSTELINVLNKSRGAGLRVVACAQTASDLEAALGSRARALQVLANCSTLVQFRTSNTEDARQFAEMTGDRLLELTSGSAANEPALFSSGWKGVDDFRARFGESVERREHALVPPWAIVQLPVFQFFARWEGRVFKGKVPVLR